MHPLHALAAVVLAAAMSSLSPATAAGAGLAAEPARVAAMAAEQSFDGVVEAVRQTVVAAQVTGAIVELDAKAGDVVRAGQVLLRIDARAATQNAAAGDAQVLSARASLDAATQEYERQKQLYEKSYISQAALERAESVFKATRAQLAAQGAQAAAIRTESGLHVIRAPFAGVVADVPVSLGDMAMPGRPLLAIYDPSALRITAVVPQSVAAQLAAGRAPRAELPGFAGAGQWPASGPLQILPTADPASHTVRVRVDLRPGLAGVAPGVFARLWLAMSAAAGTPGRSITVPLRAVVRRAEMTGLYVLDGDGRPALRQVRLGPTRGDRVEILSGVSAGERVAGDPEAAARAR